MSMGLVISLLLARDTTVGPARLDLTTPPVAERQAEAYRLEPTQDGMVYRGPRFTANVATDGTVRFTDKSKVQRTSPLPLPPPPGTRTLQGSIEKWMGKKARHSTAATDPPAPPNVSGYLPPNYPMSQELGLCKDPRAMCFVDSRNIVVPGGVNLDWEFQLMGLPQSDPAREEKARFLASTAPLRDRLAARAKAERMQRALIDLPSLLDALWSDDRPAAERRANLHELWREFSESDGNEPARATILAFIRKHLPAGSPDAFTPKELKALRAGSGPPFEPYGP